MNGSRYKLVKYVAKKLLGFRISRANPDKHDFDMCWSDMGIQPERLYKMKFH
jgi:hypothetical protein